MPGMLVALLLVALCGGAAKLLQTGLSLQDPALVFLAGVLLTALTRGLAPSILAAVLSVLVYDFFFVDPLYTFNVTKAPDLLSLCVFLVVAVLTSNLTARIRDQADAARQREQRTAALYAFGRKLAGAVGIDDLLPVVVRDVADQFQAQVIALLPDGGQVIGRATYPAGASLTEGERAAATWTWQHNRTAGRDTDTLADSSWLFAPLATARGAVGVLALQPTAAGALLPAEQRQLLEAMAGQAAIAIERTRVDVAVAEKAKTEAVIEAIEDGLIVLDPAGVVVHANEVACAILQVERARVIGERFEDLASRHPHYLRVRAALRDYLEHPEREGERVEITLFLRGREHTYILRPTPFRARDDSPAGLILGLQDVTYLRDQEARREQLLATFSHELRTPITSLGMALELLQQGKTTADGDGGDLVEAAREDVERLRDVAQQLLDLSRAHAMTIALERRQVDLRHVVERVLRIFSLQARERDVTLKPVLDDHGLQIIGDETKLTWAISNLISNALRYSSEGGEIGIQVTARNGEVQIAVSDTGPGIPPEQQERIFERFTQAVDGGEIGSAGLGLAIVRDIVQAHGGRIYVESQVGRGSRFVLDIPRS